MFKLILELKLTSSGNYNIFEYFDFGFRYNHGLTFTTKNTFTDFAGNPEGDMKEYNQYFQFIINQIERFVTTNLLNPRAIAAS
jgi:hypothetical protein